MKTMVNEEMASLGTGDIFCSEIDIHISPSPTLKLNSWSDFPLLTESHPYMERKESSCSSEMSSSTIDPIPKSPQHMASPLTHSSNMTLVPSSTCITNLKPRREKKNLPQKAVSFSSLEIRSYEVTLGDHPLSSFPICLSWEHTSQSTLAIDAYEELKRGLRRHGNELRLTIYERMCALNLVGEGLFVLEPYSHLYDKQHNCIRNDEIKPRSQSNLPRVNTVRIALDS